ncbi:uncharacterized protein LOC116348622, partial [Contarinia nasturtii]|uniref:uncharacterized protein LOC116348622 n=1 Tax=Contarinia nasturtii TaxID=265458 RepID=UPI0012D39EE7
MILVNSTETEPDNSGLDTEGKGLPEPAKNSVDPGDMTNVNATRPERRNSGLDPNCFQSENNVFTPTQGAATHSRNVSTQDDTDAGMLNDDITKEQIVRPPKNLIEYFKNNIYMGHPDKAGQAYLKLTKRERKMILNDYEAIVRIYQKKLASMSQKIFRNYISGMNKAMGRN